MNREDTEYHLRRAAAEHDRAANARTPMNSAIHERLAILHEQAALCGERPEDGYDAQNVAGAAPLLVADFRSDAGIVEASTVAGTPPTLRTA